MLRPTLANGRLVMLVFMLLGLLMVYVGNQDLFSAVAVSGTAALYLALAGAVLYFTESSAYSALLGDYHKYTKLLLISAAVPLLGCLLFWLGARLRATNARAQAAWPEAR
jgi:hypothetical protein